MRHFILILFVVFLCGVCSCSRLLLKYKCTGISDVDKASFRVETEYHYYPGDSLPFGMSKSYYDSLNVLRLEEFKELRLDYQTLTKVYDSRGMLVKIIIVDYPNDYDKDTITTITIYKNDSAGNIVKQKTNIYDSKGKNYGSGAWDE